MDLAALRQLSCRQMAQAAQQWRSLVSDHLLWTIVGVETQHLLGDFRRLAPSAAHSVLAIPGSAATAIARIGN